VYISAIRYLDNVLHLLRFSLFRLFLPRQEVCVSPLPHTIPAPIESAAVKVMQSLSQSQPLREVRVTSKPSRHCYRVPASFKCFIQVAFVPTSTADARDTCTGNDGSERPVGDFWQAPCTLEIISISNDSIKAWFNEMHIGKLAGALKE
jgi:hypothetical protein